MIILPIIFFLYELLSTPFYWSFVLVGFVKTSCLVTKAIIFLSTSMILFSLWYFYVIYKKKNRIVRYAQDQLLFEKCLANKDHEECVAMINECAREGFDSRPFCRFWRDRAEVDLK